jgi:hypothetical protein
MHTIVRMFHCITPQRREAGGSAAFARIGAHDFFWSTPAFVIQHAVRTLRNHQASDVRYVVACHLGGINESRKSSNR